VSAGRHCGAELAGQASCATWARPAWATGYAFRDGGIIWERSPGIEAHRTDDDGTPDAVEIVATQADRITVVDGQAVVVRADVCMTIDTEVYDVAEARTLAQAILQVCDAVEAQR
jgi:hypothetical protein